MTFRPNPGDELIIGDKVYRVAEHPAAPGMAYGQSGRRGTVYQLIDEANEAWALKVFLRQYREPRLTGQAERIQDFASLPGLRVCERQVLTSTQHVELIREHMDLAYAVMMPWIHGQTWMEAALGKEDFQAEMSLQVVRSMLHVLARMEERGLAHCDLSGPNLILTTKGKVELVDLEEMYGPELMRPEALPGGSPGYAHKTAPEGLWHARSDRFAGAVLMAEILGWCDDRTVVSAWGEGYFEPEEMQTNSERYHLLKEVLRDRWGEKLEGLFEVAWFSDTLAMCPTFTEWLAAIPEEVPERVPEADRRAESEEIDVGLLILRAERATRRGDQEEALALLKRAEGDAGGELLDEIRESIAELEETESPIKVSQVEEGWRCRECGRIVKVENETCPYCERGRQDAEEASALEVVDPTPVKKLDETRRELGEEVKYPPIVAGRDTERKRGVAPGVWLAAVSVVLLIIIGVSGLGGGNGSATEEPREPAEAPTELVETEASVLTSTEASPAEPDGGSTMVSELDGIVMVYVPEGSFLMGSTSDDSDAYDDEFPQHEVYLNGFWIDQTEVTNAMFASFLNEEGNQRVGGETWLDAGSEDVRIEKVSGEWRAVSGYGEHPVEEVTWYGAWAYCEWAGRRLPSEAEWEKAARGEDGRIYPWGDENPSCDLADYGGCKWGTKRVGSYVDGASPYGALDMAGNVWEWVADWYDSEYYDISPSENPTGPSSGERRVLRGGSCDFLPECIRTAFRFERTPVDSSFEQGFRCARDSSP